MSGLPPEQPETHWAVGAWLSAALDDPNVCEEMKADIGEWFDRGGSEHICRAVPEQVMLSALRMCDAADNYGVNHLDTDDIDAEAQELSDATLSLRAALAKYATQGTGGGDCPRCSGDCSAANPPVIDCPHQAAITTDTQVGK